MFWKQNKKLGIPCLIKLLFTEFEENDKLGKREYQINY